MHTKINGFKFDILKKFGDSPDPSPFFLVSGFALNVGRFAPSIRVSSSVSDALLPRFIGLRPQFSDTSC